MSAEPKMLQLVSRICLEPGAPGSWRNRCQVASSGMLSAAHEWRSHDQPAGDPFDSLR
jgi:hypothetical protein